MSFSSRSNHVAPPPPPSFGTARIRVAAKKSQPSEEVTKNATTATTTTTLKKPAVSRRQSVGGEIFLDRPYTAPSLDKPRKSFSSASSSTAPTTSAPTASTAGLTSRRFGSKDLKKPPSSAKIPAAIKPTRQLSDTTTFKSLSATTAPISNRRPSTSSGFPVPSTPSRRVSIQLPIRGTLDKPRSSPVRSTPTKSKTVAKSTSPIMPGSVVKQAGSEIAIFEPIGSPISPTTMEIPKIVTAGTSKKPVKILPKTNRPSTRSSLSTTPSNTASSWLKSAINSFNLNSPTSSGQVDDDILFLSSPGGSQVRCSSSMSIASSLSATTPIYEHGEDSFFSINTITSDAVGGGGSSNSRSTMPRRAGKSEDFGKQVPRRQSTIGHFRFQSTGETPFSNSPTPDDDGSSGAINIEIEKAKLTGKLYISGHDLKVWPENLWKYYTLDADVVTTSSNKWWENTILTRIVAANNQLQCLDTRIEEFTELNHLDLHNNEIHHVPIQVAALTKLCHLNLASNRLKALPDVLFDLPLVELNLEHNHLEALSEGLRRLGKLRTLNISDNQLEVLPSNVWSNLKHLRYLNVSQNRLKQLPLGMNGLTQLQELLVNENSLVKTFPEPVELPMLERLELHRNQLTIFCEFTIKLPILRELIISANKLKKLDQVLYTTPLLRMLDLKQNKLENLPRGLFLLDNLRRLDIGANELRQLAPELGLLSELQSLNYEGNPLKAIPRVTDLKNLLKTLRQRLVNEVATIDQLRAEALLDFYPQPSIGALLEPESEPVTPIPQARKLVIPNIKLEITPQCIATRSLSLEQRKLTDSNNAHPPILPELPFEPIDVDLSQNLYCGFPKLLVPFSQTLVTLCLSSNRLDHFPQPPVTFPSLKFLDLSFNSITSWPEEDTTSRFPELIELNLGRNKLKSMPVLRLGFPRLQTLLMRGNKLESLSPQACLGLHVLDVADNDIRQLPYELGRCSGVLRHLGLEGNSFRIPRRDIVEKGTDSVLEWLRDHIR